MSKHTPGPWEYVKHDTHSQWLGTIDGEYARTKHGMKSIRTIACLCKYGTVDENEANAARIVDCVNALAGRDPSKLADLEKAVAAYIHADPMVRGEAYRDMVNALTAFSPDSLKRSPGPRLIAGMNKLIDRVKSGEFRKEAP